MTDKSIELSRAALPLVAEAFGSRPIDVVDFNGVDDGFSLLSYQRRGFEGRIMPFRLQPGDNLLRLSVSSPFGSPTTYEFVITRPGAQQWAGRSYTTIHELEFLSPSSTYARGSRPCVVPGNWA